MVLRFYSNALSQASRTVAASIMVLAAVVFFIAGVGCGVTAVKIFWAQHRLERMMSDDPQAYRKNVQIHTIPRPTEKMSKSTPKTPPTSDPRQSEQFLNPPTKGAR